MAPKEARRRRREDGTNSLAASGVGNDSSQVFEPWILVSSAKLQVVSFLFLLVYTLRISLSLRHLLSFTSFLDLFFPHLTLSSLATIYVFVFSRGK